MHCVTWHCVTKHQEIQRARNSNFLSLILPFLSTCLSLSCTDILTCFIIKKNIKTFILKVKSCKHTTRLCIWSAHHSFWRPRICRYFCLCGNLMMPLRCETLTLCCCVQPRDGGPVQQRGGKNETAGPLPLHAQPHPQHLKTPQAHLPRRWEGNSAGLGT